MINCGCLVTLMINCGCLVILCRFWRISVIFFCVQLLLLHCEEILFVVFMFFHFMWHWLIESHTAFRLFDNSLEKLDFSLFPGNKLIICIQIILLRFHFSLFCLLGNSDLGSFENAKESTIHPTSEYCIEEPWSAIRNLEGNVELDNKELGLVDRVWINVVLGFYFLNAFCSTLV